MRSGLKDLCPLFSRYLQEVQPADSDNWWTFCSFPSLFQTRCLKTSRLIVNKFWCTFRSESCRGTVNTTPHTPLKRVHTQLLWTHFNCSLNASWESPVWMSVFMCVSRMKRRRESNQRANSLGEAPERIIGVLLRDVWVSRFFNINMETYDRN